MNSQHFTVQCLRSLRLEGQHTSIQQKTLRCVGAFGSLPNPDFLLGGRTSASAECRHWSGRQSVGQAKQFCLGTKKRPQASAKLTPGLK